MKLKLGEKEYDLEKVARKISIWQYLELEDQAGITLDQIQGGELSLARMLASYAFLVRRHGGEDVTFQQAAEELVPGDMIFPDEVEDETPPDPTPASGQLDLEPDAEDQNR